MTTGKINFSFPQVAVSRSRPNTAPRKLRSGIGGIEKSIAAKSLKTDTEISKAFQDLDKLMEMAKPMVILAKNISGKIKVPSPVQVDTKLRSGHSFKFRPIFFLGKTGRHL